MKLRPLLIMISAGALTAASFSSHSSSLRDSFDYYKSNPAGSYDTASMQGWVGPSFSARNNIVNPRLITTQMPSWSAGCGGIDFFAGSFSIITKDEIVQMARGIAQGAPGYFFNLAVAAVCPTCQQQMADLQQKLEKFNELTQNTCESVWNSELANNQMDKARAWGQRQGVSQDANDGIISDLASWVAKATPEKTWSTNMTEAVAGNDTQKVAERGITKPPSVMDDIHSVELFTSIFGATVTVMVTDASGNQVPETTFVEPTDEFFSSIVFANRIGSIIKIHRCDDGTCVANPATMTPQDYAFAGLVQDTLYYLTLVDDANTGVLDGIKTGKAMVEGARTLFVNAQYPYQEMLTLIAERPTMTNTLAEVLSLKIARDQLQAFYIPLRERYVSSAQAQAALGDEEGTKGMPVNLDTIEKRVREADKRYEQVIEQIDVKISRTRDHFALYANIKQLMQ